MGLGLQEGRPRLLQGRLGVSVGAVFAQKRHGALFRSQQRPETPCVQVAADTSKALQLYSKSSCCSVQQTCEL